MTHLVHINKYCNTNLAQVIVAGCGCHLQDPFNLMVVIGGGQDDGRQGVMVMQLGSGRTDMPLFFPPRQSAQKIPSLPTARFSCQIKAQLRGNPLVGRCANAFLSGLFSDRKAVELSHSKRNNVIRSR
jgi:hypothetical protein